jgi:NADH-quinone oxidoreductase subunit N
MLLSLAGMPLTAGFLGKFYVIAAGVHAALWLLVVILAINSAVGLFYYLRVLVALYAPPGPMEKISSSAAAPSSASSLVLAVLMFLLVGIGIYPSPVLRVIPSSPPSQSRMSGNGVTSPPSHGAIPRLSHASGH